MWMCVCRIIEVCLLVATQIPARLHTWHARKGVCAFLFISRWSLEPDLTGSLSQVNTESYLAYTRDSDRAQRPQHV